MAKSSLILSLAALALAGCASVPTAPEAAKPAPSARVFAGQGAGEAVVTVVRDSGVVGAACYFGVYLDGKLAARLDVGERVRFNVAPGEVLLGVSRDPQGSGGCSTQMDPVYRTVETLLKPGQEKTFRLALSLEGGPNLYRVDR